MAPNSGKKGWLSRIEISQIVFTILLMVSLVISLFPNRKAMSEREAKRKDLDKARRRAPPKESARERIRQRVARDEPARSNQRKNEPTPPVRLPEEELLEVAAKAACADIRAAYRRLAARYHPDLHQEATSKVRTDNEQKMKAINAAYAILQKLRC